MTEPEHIQTHADSGDVVSYAEHEEGTCACGCGGRTVVGSRGTLNKWLNGHWRKVGLPPEYRVDETTGCWLWQRTLDTHGYAIMRIEGRQRLMHRVYYERAKGPVPAGLHLDHLCRVPLCVNPAHLEPVTNAENCRRGVNAKLTQADVDVIRASTESHAALGRRFGVWPTTIFKIRAGQAWPT